MWFNNLKTLILLTLLSGILMLFGFFIGGQSGLTFAFIFALIINMGAYFFSDKLVLKMYNAQPLDKNTYNNLYEMVSELSQAMEIPMPKLWLIHTPMANAFATGRNPQNASVAVTTGILEILEAHELRGVLAHELAHIKNRDILISTIAATIAATISYSANMLQHMVFWQSVGNRNNRRNQNPIVMFIVALIMPFAALLIQLAISRSREYQADETGAALCHDPLALASALEKLHNHIPEAHLNNTAAQTSTAHLFIVNPFTTSSLVALFSTHPPMKKRVERLKKMYESMF